jgi:hypothetical protein
MLVEWKSTLNSSRGSTLICLTSEAMFARESQCGQRHRLCSLQRLQVVRAAGNMVTWRELARLTDIEIGFLLARNM